jgi:hypothetical protein
VGGPLQSPSLAEPGGSPYICSVQTLIHLLMLYLKYSLVTLAMGIVVAAGLWLWLSLASFARSARNDV